MGSKGIRTGSLGAASGGLPQVSDGSFRLAKCKVDKAPVEIAEREFQAASGGLEIFDGLLILPHVFVRKAPVME